MLSWIKAKLRDHFGFSKAETHGTLVLLLLTSLCLLLPQALQWYHSTHPEMNNEADMALLESTLALLASKKGQEKSQYNARITSQKKTNRSCQPMPLLASFDINTCSAKQLQQIQGIGPVLSKRVVKYRDRLGGFVRQAQYEEVYGLKPTVIEALRKYVYISSAFQPKRLNINTDSLKTLAAHPYLTYQQAQGIVRYRTQHGLFSNLEALRSLVLIDEATLAKVKPYLTVSFDVPLVYSSAIGLSICHPLLLHSDRSLKGFP